MPNFRYRALTQGGEVVSGLIAASSPAEVARRIQYLRLVPIDTVLDDSAQRAARRNFSFGSQGRSEDVIIFTLDLALILKAGARLDRSVTLDRDQDSLECVGRRKFCRCAFASQRSVLGDVCRAGACRRGVGKLERILEMPASERSRAEALRRKLADDKANSEMIILPFDNGPEPYAILSWQDQLERPSKEGLGMVSR